IFNFYLNWEEESSECQEYAKLVYAVEDVPVLRIDAGTNTVSKCGIVETPLIVGGTKAKPMEFPHMALIGYGQKEIFWQCGGTLISDKFVLTAAHCIDSRDKGPATKVRVGLINSKDPGPSMQERNVIERITHPDYKLPLRYNDIALIKLENPVDLNAEVRPACLETEEILKDKKFIASGFGKTAYEAETGSDDLMKVTLDKIETDECKEKFKSEVGSKQMPDGLKDTMICAGVMEGGKDTCQGDSGGPLQRVLHTPYCTYSVLGITSFGKFCAFKNSPAIYTRVYSYLDWIEKIVWS
ncbi:serine protease snake, partial [Microplitis demolitor]|uniref:serine protease snake n=1 Tax=Microplitis demolitor TaxID=69319 RepID=UPI0004CDCE69